MKNLILTQVQETSMQWLSPVQSWLAPKVLNENELRGFQEAQKITLHAIRQVAREVVPGWTEKKAARLLDTYLMDSGVQDFFHHSFAWFGERTCFDGIRGYAQFSPTERVLQEGEVFILDSAPIVAGYICDLGYTECAGQNSEYKRAMDFLWRLRTDIPKWALQCETGGALWKKVEEVFHLFGYECAHERYPFGVLGHRVHRQTRSLGKTKILNFGLSSYAELSSRLLWDQLLTKKHARPLRGVWAIEPHLAFRGNTSLTRFGAKFEEILYVTENSAEWIQPEGEACLPAR